jgi:hypothetical protein
LNGDGSEEFTGMTKITSASGKEKTCSEAFLIGKIATDCAGNGGLASAGYSTQPKDTWTARIFAPFLDLLEEGDSGFGQALRLLLPKSGVESGTIIVRKFIYPLVLLCVGLAFNVISNDV